MENSVRSHPANGRLGMGQNETTRGPPVLVFVSISQGSILGNYLMVPFWLVGEFATHIFVVGLGPVHLGYGLLGFDPWLKQVIPIEPIASYPILVKTNGT